MKKLIILCIAIAVCIVGANIVVPVAAGECLYYSLSRKMDVDRSDVQVTAQPGLKILAGAMDSATVHSRNFHVGDVVFDRLDCDLSGVRFGLLDSLASGRLVLVHADSGELTATVRSEALQEFLIRKVDKLSDPVVTFENNQVHVSGMVAIGGFLKAQADLQGVFTIKENKLVFVPSSLTVDGFGKSFNSTKPTTIEVYDFGDFPLGIQPDSVTMDNQVLTIHGSVHHT
ncbi:MAG: DUF2993 domain-containing protein [Megasphaera sp.]|jgi:hypothetical protein|nr:DUF2993 domain-containing protein [Megasphaera sp.]MCH4188253.1 DUF2993 domain-containing protein [Megasphaera sp.]MCH4217313.1 DUF2993 domain-containing protein [Megasphaera sp.]